MSAYKCSVLVVDDEPEVLLALARLLSKEFEVITASSAEAACDLLRHREYDMILSDQVLPGMSGVQLLEWVKQKHPRTARLLMTGIARFEDAVAAINCGQVSRYIFKPWHSEELLLALRTAAKTYLLERSHDQLLEQLRELNLQLEARVVQRTHELQEANQQLQQKNWMLEKLALTDPLTGLPNRRAMDRLAKAELRRRVRYPSDLALGMIDADNFKAVNARYLLPGGDATLVGLGKSLLSSMRTVDNVGRIGGEEFEVVAPETSRSGASILAERMRSAVENSCFTYQEETIHITISIGFCVVEAGVAAEYDQLKHFAAAALGEAKNAGRNCCVVHTFEPARKDEG